MFNEKEIKILEEKGLSQEKVEWQINKFISGVDPVELVAPATTEKGVMVIEDLDFYIKKYKDSEIKATKFIPASGAASRMFKHLFEFRQELNATDTIDISNNQVISEFFGNIKKFAFYSDLDIIFKGEGGMERVVANKKYALVLDTLLGEEHLAYGTLPKGLIKFHYYAGNIGRTPFEEHMVEGAKYANSKDGNVNLHFTVSPEHMELFEQLKEKAISKYEDMYRVKYNISFSIQKSSTDTIAVTLQNTPFYEKDGSLLFRPGGHGALIENLNDIDSDIIFIKNIDNVVPEKRIKATISFKQALAGLLVDTQTKIFDLCKALNEALTEEVIAAAKSMIKDTLCLSESCYSELEGKEEVNALINRLNRPLRICGMVRNEGEPGGGPFIIKDGSNCMSPQVVESSQIDANDSEQMKLLNAATHFNPVDIVCAVKDFNGEKFDLLEFVDDNTCFISNKSKNGKDLKALELPGLWNGAMAGWNTIFVEVPISTFNPVKTVNDLLRDAHQ